MIFQSAPIWVNEWLVHLIRLLVLISLVIFLATAIWFVYKTTKFLIEMKKEKTVLRDFYKEKEIRLFFSGFLLSVIILISFFMPQQVMPDSYSFDKVFMDIETPSFSPRGIIEITDREALDEFANIFKGYDCRRRLFSSSYTMIDSEVVSFDLFVHNKEKNKAFPLHFVVKKDDLKRYSSGNTSFSYRIIDKEHDLENKLFDYAKSIKSKNN